MRIRKFKNKDAEEVFNFIKKGFQDINSPYYSQESIIEQIESNTPEKLIEKSIKVNYFVVTEKNKILGIGGFDKKKIFTFFVDSEYHRKGVGRKIMLKVLSEARKKGIKKLDCWSTFYAERFYSSFGFERIKKFTLACKQSSIDFILMRKEL